LGDGTTRDKGQAVGVESHVRHYPETMMRSAALSASPAHEINTLLDCFKSHRSFQTQEVIQAIVKAEQRRIQNERAGWKLAGAAIGLLLGSGDGFDFGDVFTAFTISNLGGMAHSKFSEEDMQFLEEVNSYWVVDGGSPYDIIRRIGPAKYRILVFTQAEALAFTHHVGPRGEFLIPLCMAEDVCPGFTDAKSLEVLARTFDEDNIGILAQQFYPNLQGAVRLDAVRRLRDQEAVAQHPALATVASGRGYQPIELEIGREKVFALRTDIPLHSDF
jgi:hypothetical protein